MRTAHANFVFGHSPSIVHRHTGMALKPTNFVLRRSPPFGDASHTFRTKCRCGIFLHHAKMEHKENICKIKSVQAIAMSQIVAPDYVEKRINSLTQHHCASAHAEEL
jgi:hypothetical protein